MAAHKRRKESAKKRVSEFALIMIAPKQSAADLARRLEIREELHDMRAKTVRGKNN
jgi:hypothetical protein